ncbi:E3 ubiquitin-protein ligase RGLG1-like isoform X2 [Papaver somniferum]|uniref:E3 ubiquitin-protein ligase RGLG1-like isoform X2 n=1 Tax=Papaver somniferum TaxID=3469 RepID=UPI000E702D45|nr:E3 ubiquitin-protein ligase RGLG1-like isoform X2 [Papaver somniferum]
MSRSTQNDDNYDILEQVIDALIGSGLESAGMIVGIDFTKSNEWTGATSFNNKSLHHIGEIKNPYELAVTVIGGSLSGLNSEDNNLIPCFGFGDASTNDKDVFSFYSDQRSCNGIEGVLECYRELVPHVRLAGPTSFAPIIETAIDIVENSGRRYHLLLIIADGQVTRSADTEIGQLSRQEQETIDAIVKASKYPLSIVLVGVGDGPWDMMKEFDNNIPHRTFDNFQFVNFTEIWSQDISLENMRSQIALAAFMEIPAQYLATLELPHLGHTHERWRSPLPPPTNHHYQQSPLPCPTDQLPRDDSSNSAAASISRLAEDTHEEAVVCPICFENPRNLVFGCGHRTCEECGRELSLCPICQTPITIRIKLYS